MKLPNKTDWLLLAVLALMGFAGAVLWKEIYLPARQAQHNGIWTEPYRKSMEDLKTSTEVLKQRFDGNHAAVIEIRRPKPAVTILPAAAPSSAPAPGAPILLQGISWQSDNPLAMVNGKVYAIGARIEDCTLIGITINTIRLRAATGEITEIKLMEEVSP